jgi:hypothetical protein
MVVITQEQFDKLPKWVREYIEKIERERDTAVRTLNEAVDQQTPSIVSYTEFACTGEKQGPSPKTVYVQTHQIDFEYNSMKLSVICHNDEIRLRYENAKLVPMCYNGLNLIELDSKRYD